jgi:hypothetical protein
MQIQLQARSIVRLAKKHKLTLGRGGLGEGERTACARAVLRETSGFNGSIYDNAFARLLGVDREKLDGLEAGFEGEPVEGHDNSPTFLRYYKVGKRVAELAGLDD